MSVRIVDLVLQNGPERQADLLVLLALANFANDDGLAWPSVATLAQRARCSERYVRRILRRLEADGWISCEISPGGRSTSRYRVRADRSVRAGAPGETVSEPRNPSSPHPGTPVPPTPEPQFPPPRNSSSPEPSMNRNTTTSSSTARARASEAGDQGGGKGSGGRRGDPPVARGDRPEGRAAVTALRDQPGDPEGRAMSGWRAVARELGVLPPSTKPTEPTETRPEQVSWVSLKGPEPLSRDLARDLFEERAAIRDAGDQDRREVEPPARPAARVVPFPARPADRQREPAAQRPDADAITAELIDLASQASPGGIPPAAWLNPIVAVHVSRWLSLGLTPAEIVGVARSQLARYGRPPGKPELWDRAMATLAAAKSAPPPDAALQERAPVQTTARHVDVAALFDKLEREGRI